MNVTVRHMTKEDIPGALEVERMCFSEPWSEQDYTETLLLPYARYYVCEAEGVIVGICGVRMIAGEGQISNVAVRPVYRGQGLAHRMLRMLLEEARECGTSSFTLEVRSSNAPAIALYEDLGFRTEGVRRNFYTRPVEDALIQWIR